MVSAAPATWIDHNGRSWKTPTILGRLKFKIPCHRALRAFVFHRDRFTCQQCGARVEHPPTDYDGREALWTSKLSTSRLVRRYGWKMFVPLTMDHILSRRNGGAHHPSNLQALCDSCNCAKAGLVDARYVRRSTLEVAA